MQGTAGAVARIAALVMIAGFAGADSSAAERPRLELELEGGAVWQTVNDQQIPNTAEGSRFSLVDLAGKGPQPAYRALLTWRFADRHSLRGLVAPLEFTESGTPAAPLRFAGEQFTAGASADATYRFNSYRLSYIYDFQGGANWDWSLGFTAKIRDARVRLVQGFVVATKDNVGFVPLLHLELQRRLGANWFLDLDLDALAGGPGRAEDLAVKLGRDFGERFAVTAGYRTIEGGADVEEAYSFAWLHYAVVSLAVRL